MADVKTAKLDAEDRADMKKGTYSAKEEAKEDAKPSKKQLGVIVMKQMAKNNPVPKGK